MTRTKEQDRERKRCWRLAKRTAEEAAGHLRQPVGRPPGLRTWDTSSGKWVLDEARAAERRIKEENAEIARQSREFEMQRNREANRAIPQHQKAVHSRFEKQRQAHKEFLAQDFINMIAMEDRRRVPRSPGVVGRSSAAVAASLALTIASAMSASDACCITCHTKQAVEGW